MDYWRSVVYLEKGEFDRSREYCNRYFDGMIKIDAANTNLINVDKASRAYYLGWIDLKQGGVESAKMQLEEMKSYMVDISDVDYRDLISYSYEILDCEINLREGKADVGRVLKAFGEEPAFLTEHTSLWRIYDVIMFLNSPPFIRDFLPRAYLQNGEVEKAIDAHERLVKLDPKSKDRRLVHPLNYYRLAKLYDQKGDKKKARANSRKFLELWKDADPGIPEVEDARKRLEKL